MIVLTFLLEGNFYRFGVSKIIVCLFSFLMVGLPAYCMENQAVDSPLASIYLLLNTADPGEGYEVFDGDTNHAVFDSFVGIFAWARRKRLITPSLSHMG